MDRPSSTSSSEPVPPASAEGAAARRPRWARLPWGALFACALLLLGELGTRLFFTPKYVSLETYTKYYPAAYRYGSDGSRACFPVGESFSCAPTRDMNIIPNTFPRQKPAGELRIVVIGASIPWEGPRPAKSDGNYPSRTLEILAAAHPRRALRLINLAVPGFGSTRQVTRFREALEYEPDVFVVHTHDTNEVREDKRRAYVHDLHSGLAGKLLYLHSVVVLKTWWTTQLGLPASDAVADNPELAPDTDQAARAQRWLTGLEQNAEIMLSLAKERGIPVILVGGARGDTWDMRSIGGRVYNAFLSKQVGPGVQFLDVPEVFHAANARRPRRFFKDMIHFNAEGCRLVAASLAPLIEAAVPALSR